MMDFFTKKSKRILELEQELQELTLEAQIMALRQEMEHRRKGPEKDEQTVF